MLQSTITEGKLRMVKEQYMSAFEVTADGRIQIQEVPSYIILQNVQKTWNMVQATLAIL